MIKRLTTEALDLDRFYYSTDLSKKIKKTGWNSFCVAIVNFFSGCYELRTLVNNVNTAYFHMDNPAIRSRSKVDSLRQKLELKCPYLNNPDAEPSKSPIKAYEDDILYDFLWNCQMTTDDVAEKESRRRVVAPAPAAPIPIPVSVVASSASLLVPSALPVVEPFDAPELAPSPPPSIPYLLPTVESTRKVIAKQLPVSGSVAARAEQRNQQLEAERSDPAKAFESLNAECASLLAVASKSIAALARLQTEEDRDLQEAILGKCDNTLVAIRDLKFRLLDFVGRNSTYTAEILTGLIAGLTEKEAVLSQARKEAVLSQARAAPTESSIFSAFTGFFQ